MSATDTPDFEAVSIEQMDAEAAMAMLVSQAVACKASDLFLLTTQGAVEVAVRRWGEMKPLTTLSLAKGQQLMGAIKASAGMDIAEKRRPLDGRFIQRIEGRTVDLRVGSIPTLYGEDLSMRLLDHVGLRSLDELGMLPGDLDRLQTMLANPSGLILVSGPTGRRQDDHALRLPFATE